MAPRSPLRNDLRFTSQLLARNLLLFTSTISSAATEGSFAAHQGVCTKCTCQPGDDIGRCWLSGLRMSAWCVSKMPRFWRYKTARAEQDESFAGTDLGS